MPAPTSVDPATRLEVSRNRTLQLLADIPDELLMQPPSAIMSPLAWDLAHIGNYEELWLLQRVAGLQATNERYDDMYDAFRHERFERDELPLLTGTQARTYLDAVRARVVDLLASIELGDPDHPDPLLASGFVVSLVEQHEHQHDETILQSRNLLGDGVAPLYESSGTAAEDQPRGRAGIDHAAQVQVAAGTYDIGTTLDPRAYDNERPLHPVALDAFSIDRFPVSNARYLEFVEAGGYADDRAWSVDGRHWLQSEGARAPMGWVRASDGSWLVERFGVRNPLDPDEPVQHVCFHEASAFARWSGRRLPTEFEWEVAARGASIDDANLGGHAGGPSRIGSHPDGASALGCEHMLGDVWEWTASEFDGYPGFRAFPYREYSEVFFKQGYRVLRGGSWATDRAAIRATFRNWDVPIRRQVFAGLRTVGDAA